MIGGWVGAARVPHTSRTCDVCGSPPPKCVEIKSALPPHDAKNVHRGDPRSPAAVVTHGEVLPLHGVPTQAKTGLEWATGPPSCAY